MKISYISTVLLSLITIGGAALNAYAAPVEKAMPAAAAEENGWFKKSETGREIARLKKEARKKINGFKKRTELEVKILRNKLEKVRDDLKRMKTEKIQQLKDIKQQIKALYGTQRAQIKEWTTDLRKKIAKLKADKKARPALSVLPVIEQTFPMPAVESAPGASTPANAKK